MESVLSLVGIAALMVFGLVVLLTALTYDPPIRSSRDRPLRSERRPKRAQLRRQAQGALSARRKDVQELAVTLRMRALALADDWLPRLRHHARARVRWLTLESTAGQVIASAAASVAAGYLIAMFG